MQGVILRRFHLERLVTKTAPLSLGNYARTFASKEVKDWNANASGITGRRPRTKKKSKNYVTDPDEEFMQMWSISEGYLQDRIKEATTGAKLSRRKYVKVWRPNVSTLPLASELTTDERSELLEDDLSVEFRIPKVGDFASLTPVYKSLTEEEDDENMARNEVELEEDKSCGVLGGSNVLSFKDFNLHPKLVDKLKRYSITTPTPIQKQAIPLILNHKSILIHSETGSGKTLVFLLPAIQDPGKGFGTVIVVPTRELASQMLFEAHRLLGDKTTVASFVSTKSNISYIFYIKHERACFIGISNIKERMRP